MTDTPVVMAFMALMPVMAVRPDITFSFLFFLRIKRPHDVGVTPGIGYAVLRSFDDTSNWLIDRWRGATGRG